MANLKHNILLNSENINNISTTQGGQISDETSGDDFVTTQGGNVSETLYGNNGGNDTLRGGNGGDVYLFDYNSDHDVVDEGYRNFGSLGDTVRLGGGITASNISLSRDSFNLVLNLSDSSGIVTDTLTIKNHYVSNAAKIERVELSDGTEIFNADDFATVSWTPPVYTTGTEITGTSVDNYLFGSNSANDIFDADVGGNDRLYGLGGDDVYWLGVGTGHDRILENNGDDYGDAGDVIKIKEGFGTDDVCLYRSNNGYHLIIQLLGAADANGDREVTDSLIVEDHYFTDNAKIESLEFFDGTIWNSDEFAFAPIRGTNGKENLIGQDGINDVIDGIGGDDTLVGYGGDDVYWLRAGTGHDTINEYFSNEGDGGDMVRIDGCFRVDDVRLASIGNDLIVQLLDATGTAVISSLTVENYYTDDSAKIESVQFADGTVWDDSILSKIHGTNADDDLYGADDVVDIFGSNAGGNDNLYGLSGNDVYWLGAGIDDDEIYEYIKNSDGDIRTDGGDDQDAIKIEAGFRTGDVILERSSDGNHLIVQLLEAAIGTNDNRDVADSLTVKNYYTTDAAAKIEQIEFSDGTVWDSNDIDSVISRIRGTNAYETLYGNVNIDDVFDSNIGGNDILRGYSGNDVYWLGAGTGNDTILEHYDSNDNVRPGDGDNNDVIKIKEVISTSDVQLERNSENLYIQLLGAADANGDREVTDSFIVDSYYRYDSAKIESVEFADGTVWSADDFLLTLIKGTNADENLFGSNENDTFDSNAGGNDNLYGFSGNDLYWLGADTGNDVIKEYYVNQGDNEDVIKIKEDYQTHDIGLERSGGDLVVSILDDNGIATGDSLTVENYYLSDNARVESIEFNDGTVWNTYDIELMTAIIGTSADESLFGSIDENDIFDSSAGGNDDLYGFSGNDVYWLGADTGNDVIKEYYVNQGNNEDMIKIKEGYGTDNIRLDRSVDDLVVVLLDNNGVETGDSLTVENHYTDTSAEVEYAEFIDGTVLGLVEKKASSTQLVFEDLGNNSYLYANLEGVIGEYNVADIFDSDVSGDDDLYGFSGNDVYWLGSGTDNDTIKEYYYSSGDDADVIRIKENYGTNNIRLDRNGGDLVISILYDNEIITGDSLTVENHYTDNSAKIESIEFNDGTVWNADDIDYYSLVIRGTSSDENLDGENDVADVFDSDAGGNDNLRGGSGNDVYWLGAGTDHDVIQEYYYNLGDDADVIKIEEGFGTDNVFLERSSNGLDLIVKLVDDAGVGTDDSLTVKLHFADPSASYYKNYMQGSAIESIEFNDGTVWNADYIDYYSLAIRGTSSDENLHGENDVADVFDADAGGNDTLRGGSGNDVYWLGAGTGHDVIQEYYYNLGDDGDVIKIEEGFGTNNVFLERSSDNGLDLIVTLLDDSGFKTEDSLTVELHFADSSASYYKNYMQGSTIESIEFNDGTVWDAGDIDSISSQIRGTSADDDLYGENDVADVFDSDAGGNDNLRGRSGNDVYWLSAGTDHDVIQEYYYNLGDDGDLIKIEEGYGVNNVRLERSSNGLDLIVKLLDDTRTETGDSLTVKLQFADSSASYYLSYMQGSTIESIEFNDGTVWDAGDIDYYSSVIRGTSSDENLYGKPDVVDIFDADAGGNDILHGYSGNDVYWLGAGTDNDVIKEYPDSSGIQRTDGGDPEDMIRIEESYGTYNIRLERSEDDLVVTLLDDSGFKTDDSLTVENYYVDDSAKIESIEFNDGTVWSADDIDYHSSAIRGTSSDENLYGENNVTDVFNSDAGGNDNLRGRSGNDVYWLGDETDNDVIQEYYYNLGDDGDVIKIEEGYGINNLRLELSSNGLDLIVKLLDSTGAETGDSLTVDLQFADSSASYYKNYMQGSAVEQIEADGKVLLSTQYMALINEIAAFKDGSSTSGYNGVAEINAHFWQDESTITNPN